MCGIICLTNVRLEQIVGLGHLSHRGPDNYSIWVSPESDFDHISIGHSRLSIIDQTESANQPMTSSCGRYVIAFNGEIYNFQELRNDLVKDGCIFKTDSDTEVLLNGLISKGHEFVNKCNGMWAFILWDRVKRSLMISRDRYGKKPLYYAKTDNGHVFASEIKAIYPHIENFEFVEDVDKLFSDPFGYESTDKTFVRNVYRLPPGHFAVIHDNKMVIKRWWCTLDNIHQVPLKYEDQVEEFREIFLDAVRLRMVSDAPTATMLSGGLDSSVIFRVVNLLRAGNQRSNIDLSKLAFTSHFPNSTLDELYWAKVATESTGAKLNVVTIDPDKITYSDLVSALLAVEDPYITLPIPMLQSYNAVSKSGVKVTIDGHGADELFSGYNTIQYAIRSANFKDAAMYIAISNSLKGFEHNYSITMKDIIYAKTKAFAYCTAKDLRDRCRGDAYLKHPDRDHVNFKSMDLFSQKLYELFHMTVLPTLLRNYDRYSMNSGVEIRMPFMDHRVVSYCFSLPLSSKLGDGYTKKLLRDSMRSIVPEEILTRRDKMGWNAPIHEWLRAKLGREILEHISTLDTKEGKLATKRLSNYLDGGDRSYISGHIIWSQIQPLIWKYATTNNWKAFRKAKNNFL